MMFGVSLCTFFLLLGGYAYFISRPVIVTLTQPFRICDKNNNDLHPGSTLRYWVHYLKFKDIPGTITKELVGVTNRDEKIEIPLADTVGHLSLGITDQVAVIRIPDYTPPGKYKLKLSSTHFTGILSKRSVAWTAGFEVKP